MEKLSLEEVLEYYPYAGAHGLHELLTTSRSVLRDGKPVVLHVFDFDGTLFRSPMPSRALWHAEETAMIINDLQWFQAPETLRPPLVPRSPGLSWFIPDVLQAARKASKLRRTDERRHHLVCLMTGRQHDAFHERIKEMLPRDLHFDLFICKEPKVAHASPSPFNDGQTWGFKMRFIETIFNFIPTIRSVHVWDDRESQVKQFQFAFLEMKRNGKMLTFDLHHIRDHHPVPPQMEKRAGTTLEGFHETVVGRLRPLQEVELVRHLVEAYNAKAERLFDFTVTQSVEGKAFYLHPESIDYLKRLFPILSTFPEAEQWRFDARSIPLDPNPYPLDGPAEKPEKDHAATRKPQEVLATHVAVSSSVSALALSWPSFPGVHHTLRLAGLPNGSLDSIETWHLLDPPLRLAVVYGEDTRYTLIRKARAEEPSPPAEREEESFFVDGNSEESTEEEEEE